MRLSYQSYNLLVSDVETYWLVKLRVDDEENRLFLKDLFENF